MTLLKLSVAAATICALGVSAYAEDAKPKRTIKNNMMEVYNTLPAPATTLSEAFGNGVFYGRLRTNAFKWDWKDVDADNKAFGIGGSMIYKTAPLSGVSATAGMYYANSPFSSLREDNADVGSVKAGKDTFSRYNVKTTGDWSMAVLAQAYLQYDVSKTSFKVGRQIFESFLTKSNDTKMIPNTFEGYSVVMKELPKTTIRAAYFNKQKLRDHTTFHDVVTFKDGTGDSWNNNDDSAVHKGLSYANFTAAGEDTSHDLIVADIRNKSIENLQLDLTYGLVPDVVSSLTAEANYKIDLSSGYSLTPGVRYMMQMDEGGGKVGGATLKGNFGLDKIGSQNQAALDSYDDPDNLDSSLFMARLVLKNGPLKIQAAYSAVADEGDIVAPWRGFPTGGYTRAMAQYNWYANTKTTAAEIFYDFGKAKVFSGFSTLFRYAIQDFDEDKQAVGVQADSNILHMDFRKQFASVPGLDAKIRIGLVSADDRVTGGDKDSYNEYRFELNYLF